MLKKIIIKNLNYIKRTLIILKKHCLPSLPPLSPYDLYVQDQTKKCFENFKPYFLKSIFIQYTNYPKYVIEKALENKSKNEEFYLEFGVWSLYWEIN